VARSDHHPGIHHEPTFLTPCKVAPTDQDEIGCWLLGQSLSSTGALFDHRELPNFPSIFGAEIGADTDFLKIPQILACKETSFQL
jgi:hypothetical protein